MPVATVCLVLCSALLHAGWNALLRAGQDRLRDMAWMCTASALVGLGLAVWLPAPDPACYWCLVGSAVLQDCYCLFLVRAYRDGDFGQMYPIARGSSPLLVTAGAAWVAGEWLSVPALLGVLLVSSGIAATARGVARAHTGSLLAALATGMFIAAYTVVDGIGARLSQQAVSYAAWLAVLQGAPMPVLFVCLRRRSPFRQLDRSVLRALGGGLVSLIAYATVLVALSLSPMGKVSALRETSILFAVLLARVVFKERLTRRRLTAAALIATGATMLSFARDDYAAPTSSACISVRAHELGERAISVSLPARRSECPQLAGRARE